jgi:hypothetical protein
MVVYFKMSNSKSSIASMQQKLTKSKKKYAHQTIVHLASTESDYVFNGDGVANV